MYQFITAGGTFDRFHRGHAALLGKAFAIGKKVILGITSDKMIKEGKFNGFKKKRLAKLILPQLRRKKEVTDFLLRNNFFGRTELITLDDPYGPTISDQRLEAVVATKETLEGARMINRKRKEENLPALKIVLAEFIKSEDGRHISSGRIRKGETDRNGHVFVSKKEAVKINKTLRRKLKKPLGFLAANLSSAKKIIERNKPFILLTVGDKVTADFLENQIFPDLSIIDFKTQRAKMKNCLFDKARVIKVRNKPGEISRVLLQKIKKAINEIIREKDPAETDPASPEKNIGLSLSGKTRFLKVIGEEDLAVLPAILCLPLNSLVAYGQPKKGIVLVEITEKMKEKVRKIFKAI